MKLAFASVALAACTTSSIGSNPQPDDTLAFSPTVITFERFAATCGIMNPPFVAGDLFALTLLGVDAPGPRTGITVSFQRDIPRDEPIAIDLQPFGVVASSTDANGHVMNFLGQNGTISAGSDGSFGFSQGIDPNELDPSAIQSATIEVHAVPQAEGAYGSIRIDLTFTDGKVFDTLVEEPIHTGFSGCPAG
jgi:hypothetical protein